MSANMVRIVTMANKAHLKTRKTNSFIIHNSSFTKNPEHEFTESKII